MSGMSCSGDMAGTRLRTSGSSVLKVRGDCKASIEPLAVVRKRHFSGATPSLAGHESELNRIISVSSSLPSEMLSGATLRDQEYGWSLAVFPSTLALAEQFNLACLGGQMQFRFEDAIFEAYWLCADASERTTEESWSEYVHRSCHEVTKAFHDLVTNLNVQEVIQKWPGLRAHVKAGRDAETALVFVAYFVTEAEYIAL